MTISGQVGIYSAARLNLYHVLSISGIIRTTLDFTVTDCVSRASINGKRAWFTSRCKANLLKNRKQAKKHMQNCSSCTAIRGWGGLICQDPLKKKKSCFTCIKNRTNKQIKKVHRLKKDLNSLKLQILAVYDNILETWWQISSFYGFLGGRNIKEDRNGSCGCAWNLLIRHHLELNGITCISCCHYIIYKKNRTLIVPYFVRTPCPQSAGQWYAGANTPTNLAPELASRCCYQTLWFHVVLPYTW